MAGSRVVACVSRLRVGESSLIPRPIVAEKARKLVGLRGRAMPVLPCAFPYRSLGFSLFDLREVSAMLWAAYLRSAAGGVLYPTVVEIPDAVGGSYATLPHLSIPLRRVSSAGASLVGS